MGKTVPIEPSALAWAHQQFGRFYQAERIDPPRGLARREFAMFPFAAGTLMRRHEAFRTPEEFRDFLKAEAPRHVYYSSAYYQAPEHPKMDGKGWLGADLIFDLDADHLRGAEGLDYAGQLELVKRRVADLMDDFLFGDFGIDPEKTSLVFSGGRGYHVHVQEEAYLPLTSAERRELVDYVLGVGVDGSSAVREVREDGGALSRLAPTPDGEPGGRAASTRPRVYKRLYPPDAPGWRGRTARAVLTLLARWTEVGPQAAQAELERFGLPRPKARALARLLVKEGRGKMIQESLSLEVFRKEVPQEFLDVVLRQAAVEVQGETDAPVTTDVHRLIRLPGSLHGGTGFRVTRLTRAGLDRFDPFRDATLTLARGSETAVELGASVDYPFPHAIHGAAGDRRSMPTTSALFLVLRGEASLRP